LVTPLPIETEFNPVQCMNAAIPMLVTLSGIVTVVKAVQRLKEYGPMETTPLPMVKEVRAVQL
jgi:hypothetical protein